MRPQVASRETTALLAAIRDPPPNAPPVATMLPTVSYCRTFFEALPAIYRYAPREAPFLLSPAALLCAAAAALPSPPSRLPGTYLLPLLTRPATQPSPPSSWRRWQRRLKGSDRDAQAARWKAAANKVQRKRGLGATTTS